MFARPRWTSRLPLLAVLLTACDSTTRPATDGATLRFSAVVTATTVTEIVVTVTAADISTPLVFNFAVVDGTASGTLRIPPGTARTILAEAFDATGTLTHDGSATIDVQPGQNPPVSILLRSRAGQVPIIVTIADVTVAVSPASATLSVGATVQLTATILGPEGEVLDGAISWATTNPAFAKVDQQGLVTAIAAGKALIVATHEGVAGASAITVVAGDITGTVVITEFLANPNAVADAAGEWLELHNPTTSPVNIEGWTLADDGTDLHVIDAGGAGVVIPAGGSVVLGINADAATNGGITVQYQYATFLLANGADEIVLRDAVGGEVDRVVYDPLLGWPVVIGQSTSLDPVNYDVLLNDVAASWCASTTLLASGDTGTPGALNETCPGSP